MLRFDGDIVFSTNNSYMIDNVIPNLNPISYDKASAPAQKLTPSNIIASDVRSFDCKIGQTTNFSTKFISMLPLFDKDSEQYKELVNRIKQLRRYIGDSIDSAKGIKTKPFPQEWKRRYKFFDTDTEETRKQKQFYNSLVGKKKPYFFVYIYDALYADYRKHKKNYNMACRERFGCKLAELLGKDGKSTEEKKFIREYYNRMPVTRTNCVINRLCWMIEAVEFEFTKNKPCEYDAELVDVLTDKDIEFSRVRYKQTVELYSEYKKNYNKLVSQINSVAKGIVNARDNGDSNKSALNDFYSEMRSKAESICSNPQEFANYAVKHCYIDSPNIAKDFVWTIAIEGLMLNIAKNKSDVIEVPVRDGNGIEYLGAKYSLQEVRAYGLCDERRTS